MEENPKEITKMKTSIELKKELEQIEAKKEQLWKEEKSKVENDLEYDEEEYRGKRIDLIREEERINKEYQTALNREVKVGDGITISLYSDAHAYTIIKRTANTITIQRDKATLKEDFKPEIIPMGFAGRCMNNYEQDYDYERDEDGTTKILHWSEKYGNWIAKGGSVSLGRHEFYDYNF